MSSRPLPRRGRAPLRGLHHLPGLVNAHTHLTLTALAGVVPSLPFTDWLPRLVAALKPWEVADHEASGVVGAELSLLAGVTVVGDIAYGAAEVVSASQAGPGRRLLLGGARPDRRAPAGQLEALRYPSRQDAFGPRVVPGLSPHSPYTSGPELLKAVHERGARWGAPFRHPRRRVRCRERAHARRHGPACRRGRTHGAHGFVAPEIDYRAYLDALGVLDGTTVVHPVQLEPGDVALLAAVARGVVDVPPLEPLPGQPAAARQPRCSTRARRRRGHRLRGEQPRPRPARRGQRAPRRRADAVCDALLEIATARGASAIGVGDRFGSLAPGMQADLAVFGVGVRKTPKALWSNRAARLRSRGRKRRRLASTVTRG